MINPANSIWNKPKFVRISDRDLLYKWLAIKKHLINTILIRPIAGETNLVIDEKFIIAKHSKKFRLISQIDWAVYDTKDLANAIDTNTIDSYYEQMLADPQSDPNIWNDKIKEHELKTHYAERAGRASKI
jgi:hypothetical protein